MTTADGVVRNIFYDRGTYVWANRDVSSLASTIDSLLSDAERYREQVDRGLETFDEMTLTLEDALDVHLEVYEDLVGTFTTADQESEYELRAR